MDLTVFTVEQENLIAIFDVSSRAACVADIRAALPDFDEPELREIAGTVLKTLENMTDAEFSALSFNPAYFNDDDEINFPNKP